jgi:hypothetical protein
VVSPRSRNGWPSGPDAAAPARLAAQRMVAGRQQVRTPATPVVALSASSVRRADVRPIGRADVRCPHVRCPRDRFHPGVRTDRPPVSAALQPRCLCRAGPWNGSVERAAPLGAAGSTCRRGPLAAWSPDRIRSDGKGWCCVGPCLARTRVRRQPRPPLRRRTGCAPPRRRADKGACPAPGCRPVGWGARDGADAHQFPAGASWGGCRRGARPWGWTREVVTTLRGRWAGDGPVSSSSGGPTRFGGEQPAAAARPRHVRSAVRQVLTGH